MDVIVGDVECPRCGLVEHVVALEDGVWMCIACVVEFCEDDEDMGGNSSHSGNISSEKSVSNGRNWTL